MLGHLKPSFSDSDCSQKSYQGFYCGICKSLRSENGLFASALINHELTLNLLALSPFMPNTTSEKTACPSKALLGSKTAFVHPVVHQASKLSVLLGWIKSTDWSFDSKNPVAGFVERKLAEWNSRLNGEVSDKLSLVIEHYIEVIRNETPEAKLVMNRSGELARTLWLELADKTEINSTLKAELALLFDEIGKVIFQADAIEDFFKDKRRNEYNPIVIAAKSDTEAAIKFYETYRLRFIVIKTLLKQLSSHPLVSRDFVNAFDSAITNLDQSVIKKYEQILDGADPDSMSSLVEFLQAKFQASQCCCHNCCHNCKCPCQDCSCPCNNCNCNNCNCNCPTCHCNGCCDCCDGCKACCNGCSSSGTPISDPENFKHDLMREVMNSDLSDSTKLSVLRDIDSLENSGQSVEEIVDFLNENELNK